MFNLINLLVLLGGIQGFTLCVLLWKRRKVNINAYWFFVLFLFCLAFFNFIYALHYSGIKEIGGVLMTSLPFPYKYLIGVGFYFYVKCHLHQQKVPIYQKQAYLFLPAIMYGLLRGYWYVVILKEGDNRIFREVYDSGFFIYNEFVYLGFDLLLISMVLLSLKKFRNQEANPNKKLKNYDWLVRFSKVFLCITLFNLILFVSDLVINLRDTIPFYYVVLIVNTLFIYWIGYEGFTKPNIFFSKINVTHSNRETEKYTIIQQKLNTVMDNDEMYRNKNLKLTSLAEQMDVSSKDLSAYINDVHQINFSEYLNRLRVEKVKELLNSSESEKYTLLTLAEEAGFSSKSSFNTIFKKVTGQTPTEYKKSVS